MIETININLPLLIPPPWTTLVNVWQLVHNLLPRKCSESESYGTPRHEMKRYFIKPCRIETLLSCNRNSQRETSISKSKTQSQFCVEVTSYRSLARSWAWPASCTSFAPLVCRWHFRVIAAKLNIRDISVMSRGPGYERVFCCLLFWYSVIRGKPMGFRPLGRGQSASKHIL